MFLKQRDMLQNISDCYVKNVNLYLT